MLRLMDEIRSRLEHKGTQSTSFQERRRLVEEATLIAEARADVAAGRLVEPAAVKAWIDSIGTNHELPVPYAKD
jgi:predicted transcriptional regulator